MVIVPKSKIVKIIVSVFKNLYPIFIAEAAIFITLLVSKTTKYNGAIAAIMIAFLVVSTLVFIFVEVNYINKFEDKDTGDETTKYNKDKQLNKIKNKRKYLSLLIFPVLIILLALIISFIVIKPPKVPVPGFVITKPYHGECFKKPKYSPVTIKIEGIIRQNIGNNEKLKVKVMDSGPNITPHCKFITDTHDKSKPQNWQIHGCTIPNIDDYTIIVYLDSNNNIQTQEILIHVKEEASLIDKAGDLFWKLFDIAVKKQ